MAILVVQFDLEILCPLKIKYLGYKKVVSPLNWTEGNVPDSNQPSEPHNDMLGVIHALALHMQDNRRINTDDLEDVRLFRGRKNIIVAKMEQVVDENFGGDSKAFRERMLMIVACAAFEGDDPVIAIENWLDVELQESGKLYE